MKIEARNGKKVVFINPPELIKGSVIETLIGKGFEVYLLMDHHLISTIAEEYKDTLFFINLDVGMPLNEWEEFIGNLFFLHPYINIGVLSFNRNFINDQVEKFLYQLNINCGFIQLAQGVQEVTRILLSVLDANEARGKNHLLKYSLPENGRNYLSLSLNGILCKENILEISSVGFTSHISSGIHIRQNQILRDIQLFVNGVIIRTDAIMVGIVERDNVKKRFFIFSRSSFKQQQASEKIQKLVFRGLQTQFNKEFGLLDKTRSNVNAIM